MTTHICDKCKKQVDKVYETTEFYGEVELCQICSDDLQSMIDAIQWSPPRKRLTLDAFHQWLNPNPEKVEVKRKIDLDRILTGLSIPLALFLTCWYWYQGNGAATLAYGLSLIYATLYYSTFTRNPNEL